MSYNVNDNIASRYQFSREPNIATTIDALSQAVTALTGGTPTAWSADTRYIRGAVVSDGGNNYSSNVAHVSGSTFAGDSANWDLLTPGGGGGGAVFGPGSSTDNAICRFDGVTGAVIQNSTCTIDDSGNMVIGGNLTVNGTLTYIEATTLEIADPMIKVAKNNASDLIDMGWYGLYNDGTDRYSGFFRDSTDGYFNLYDNLTIEPTTVVATGDASYNFANVKFGFIEAKGTPPTTQTGAILSVQQVGDGAKTDPLFACRDKNGNNIFGITYDDASDTTQIGMGTNANTTIFHGGRNNGGNIVSASLTLYGTQTSGNYASWELKGQNTFGDQLPGTCVIQGASAANTATVNTEGGDIVIYGGGKALAGTNEGNVILSWDGTDARGRVGIGTNSPTSTLQVGDTSTMGSISVPGAGTNTQQFGPGHTSSGDNNILMGYSIDDAGTEENVVLTGLKTLTGDNNVMIGYNLGIPTAGSDNVLIGHGSGSGAGAYSSFVCIGQGADPQTSAVSIGRNTVPQARCVVIGRDAAATASNQFVSGSATAAIDNVYFGKGPQSATPTAYTIHGTANTATDGSGADIGLQGGAPDGAGGYGNVLLQEDGGSVISYGNITIDREAASLDSVLTLTTADAQIGAVRWVATSDGLGAEIRYSYTGTYARDLVYNVHSGSVGNHVWLGTNSEIMRLTNAGSLSVVPDTDSTHAIGRLRIASSTTDYAQLSHYDNANNNDFMIRQAPSGAVAINATTGASVGIYNNGTGSGSIATFEAAAITLNEDTTINGKLTVTGLIDPTGLELDPVAANPGGVAANTLWLNSGDSNKLYLGASALDTGISSLVEDTTPQLGGNLDLNGNNIEGATASDFGYLATTTTFGGNWMGVADSSAARTSLGLTDGSSNYILGVASLSTTAGSGFPYISTCAGNPTGTPTPITGMTALVFDSSGRALHANTGGSWAKIADADDVTKLAGIEAGADVTDTANVTAAGALMDSEVDADIKTLTLPANTTITSFAQTFLDDTTAAAVRTTIGAAGVGETVSLDQDAKARDWASSFTTINQNFDFAVDNTSKQVVIHAQGYLQNSGNDWGNWSIFMTRSTGGSWQCSSQLATHDARTSATSSITLEPGASTGLTFAVSFPNASTVRLNVQTRGTASDYSMAAICYSTS